MSNWGEVAWVVIITADGGLLAPWPVWSKGDGAVRGDVKFMGAEVQGLAGASRRVLGGLAMTENLQFANRLAADLQVRRTEHRRPRPHVRVELAAQPALVEPCPTAGLKVPKPAIEAAQKGAAAGLLDQEVGREFDAGVFGLGIDQAEGFVLGF